jgi:hypothetical protein
MNQTEKINQTEKMTLSQQLSHDSMNDLMNDEYFINSLLVIDESRKIRKKDRSSESQNKVKNSM